MSSDSDDESYIANAERKAKQNYLYEEVIENNYDPELFTMFCSKTKTPDLDFWTFDDLQECVSQFKLKYRRGQTLKEILDQEPKTQKVEKAEKVKNPKTPEKKKKAQEVGKMSESEPNPLSCSVIKGKADVETKQSISSPITENQLESQYYIKCRPYEPSQLNTIKNLEFVVKTAELVEGGFLTSNYYVYVIITTPLYWECRRKYTDFLLLQEVIASQFPGHFVPPLPPNKTMGKPECDLWPKRLLLLTKFLFWINKNQAILSHPFIEQFFKLPLQSEFAKYSKTQKKKLAKIENLESCYSESGQLTCNLFDLSGKFEALTKFLNGAEGLENKLKVQSNAVLKNLKNVEEDFLALGKGMKDLEGCCENFKPFEECGKVFSVLEKGFLERGLTEKQWFDGVKEHFFEYFGYRKMEKQALRELIKAKESAWNEFKKAEIRQKMTEKAKDWFGFYNVQAYGEVLNILNEENLIIKENFSAFGKKSAEIVSNQHSLYGDLSKSLKNLKI